MDLNSQVALNATYLSRALEILITKYEEAHAHECEPFIQSALTYTEFNWNNLFRKGPFLETKTRTREEAIAYLNRRRGAEEHLGSEWVRINHIHRFQVNELKALKSLCDSSTNGLVYVSAQDFRRCSATYKAVANAN